MLYSLWWMCCISLYFINLMMANISYHQVWWWLPVHLWFYFLHSCSSYKQTKLCCLFSKSGILSVLLLSQKWNMLYNFKVNVRILQKILYCSIHSQNVLISSNYASIIQYHQTLSNIYCQYCFKHCKMYGLSSQCIYI